MPVNPNYKPPTKKQKAAFGRMREMLYGGPAKFKKKPLFPL